MKKAFLLLLLCACVLSEPEVNSRPQEYLTWAKNAIQRNVEDLKKRVTKRKLIEYKNTAKELLQSIVRTVKGKIQATKRKKEAERKEKRKEQKGIREEVGQKDPSKKEAEQEQKKKYAKELLELLQTYLDQTVPDNEEDLDTQTEYNMEEAEAEPGNEHEKDNQQENREDSSEEHRKDL